MSDQVIRTGRDSRPFIRLTARQRRSCGGGRERYIRETGEQGAAVTTAPIAVPVRAFARGLALRARQTAWLLGAGASADADVPTARASCSVTSARPRCSPPVSGRRSGTAAHCSHMVGRPMLSPASTETSEAGRDTRAAAGHARGMTGRYGVEPVMAQRDVAGAEVLQQQADLRVALPGVDAFGAADPLTDAGPYPGSRIDGYPCRLVVAPSAAAWHPVR
jgi:hypothetical protein